MHRNEVENPFITWERLLTREEAAGGDVHPEGTAKLPWSEFCHTLANKELFSSDGNSMKGPVR